MSMNAVRGIRPTKGYLFELKKRITFVEKGCEFLKMKRDHLARELRASIEVLRGRRKNIETKLEKVYDELATAYLSLGPSEVKSQVDSIKKTLEVDVLPKSVMGVYYPFVKILSKPAIEGKMDITLYKAAQSIFEIFDELVSVAEFEARVEKIAEELGKTSRKVNALENIVIPSYKRIIKYIENKLEEEMLEEFVRIKLICGAQKRQKE